MLGSLASVVFVLALLAGLLWWLRRGGRIQPRGRCLSVIDFVALGGGCGLTVVQVGERYFLMAAASGQLSLVSELGPQDVAEALRAPHNGRGRFPSSLWSRGPLRSPGELAKRG